MEGEVAMPPPVKRAKISEGGGFDVEVKVLKGGGEEDEAFDIKPVQNVPVFESPRTEPMLVPEIWEHIFEYLPPEDLITVIQTCPEWSKLLEVKKTNLLFPKVLQTFPRGFFSMTSLKACRALNRGCKEAIDLAFPEIPQIIRLREGMARHVRAIQARIRLGMRRQAIQLERQEQGLPEEEFNEEDEEEEQPGQEDEFNADQIRDFILRRLRRPQQ